MTRYRIPIRQRTQEVTLWTSLACIYSIGDNVLYEGKQYECIQPHQSDNVPPDKSDKWKLLWKYLP